MWEYNEGNLTEEIMTGGKYLEKSGCYVATVKSVKVDERKVEFVFETDGGQESGNVFFYYTHKDGSNIDFKVRHLNHFLYLNKMKDPSKIENSEGNKIGVMLKAKLSQDKRFINFDIEGFYNPKTNKTAKELKEKTKAEKVDKMKEKYAAEEPLKRKQRKSKKTETNVIEEISEDNFPF